MAMPKAHVGFFSWILAPTRAERDELIDSPNLSGADLDQSFRDIRRINRFLGGIRVIRKELDICLAPGDSATLLDLGTGTGDIPLAMIRRFRAKGCSLQAVALDASPTIVRIAKDVTRSEPHLTLLAADATRLPFADRSFDVVTCSLTFHHFSDSEGIATLKEMHRVARKAVIVNDLRRGRLPAALIWLVTRLTFMHRLTRHDGPLSVMRSRTLQEYSDLARAAGFPSAEVHSHPFWRAALVIRGQAT